MAAVSAKRSLPLSLAALFGCGPGAAAVDDTGASTEDAESSTGFASGSDSTGSVSLDGTSGDPPAQPSTSSGSETGDPFGTWGEAVLLAELTTPGGFAANAIVVSGPWLFAAADSLGEPMMWRVAIATGRVDSQTGGDVPLFATDSYVYPRCMAFLCTRLEMETFSWEQVEDVREIAGASAGGVVLIRENGPTPRRPLPSSVLSWRADESDAALEVYESPGLTRVLGVSATAVAALVDGELVRIAVGPWTSAIVGPSPVREAAITGSVLAEERLYVSSTAAITVVELATAEATTIDASPAGSTLAADPERVVWVDATEPTHVLAASAADLAIEEVAAADEAIVDLALGPDALYWLQADGAVYRVGFPG